MNREEIHSTFVRLFADPSSRPTVNLEDLTRVEAELSVAFPQAYVDFVTKYGVIYTPKILDLVTGGESEDPPEGASWDVNQFLGAEEIIKDSQLQWSGGMDSNLVGIASDSMGNTFGFRREQKVPRPSDSLVLFFDHEFCEIHEESKSFDGWLESFIRLTRQ